MHICTLTVICTMHLIGTGCYNKCDQNRHQPFSSLSVSNVVSQSNQSGDVGGAEEIFRLSSSGVSKKQRNRGTKAQ